MRGQHARGPRAALSMIFLRNVIPSARSRFALTLAMCLCAQLSALAQQTSFPAFSQIDYFFAQNPQVFQNLWQQAQTRTVRIAVLGDSQETSPGGHGSVYIPRLNYEMWKHFGNVPETPLEGCTFYGSGSPWADWLLTGSCASPGPSASRLAANQILPNMSPGAFSTLNGGININGEDFGQLTLLQQNALDVDPGADIPSDVDYFNTSGTVKAEIFAATNASSGEIAYYAQPYTAGLPSYYAPTTLSGTLTLGLRSSTFAVTSGATPPLPYNGNPYMALQIAGTDNQQLTDILGLRYFNETFPQGVIIDTYSEGGYQTSSFLANNGDAGAIFQALDFQAVILHYGANDIGAGLSAQQFQSEQEALISLVRSWVQNPDFPVILIADVYRTGLTDSLQSQFDQYVGAQLTIAQADPNVMVINSRRLMDGLGWNATSGQSATFLVDGLHYTAYGGQVLASSEVAALMGEILVTDCTTDQSSVVLEATMALTIDLSGPPSCGGAGLYNVAQSLTLNQPTLTVILGDGLAPALGQSYRIFTWGGALSGRFGTVNLPTLPAGLVWNTSALYTTGTITVASASGSAVTDAPLPLWTLGLLGASLIGAANRRVKKAA
jgi:hypothetical protein